jgi:glutathione synthase/RimK-type ligase-like ATP-grasp enzyme
VQLDPVRRHLEIILLGKKYAITPSHLRSVLFRRPVFLRDYGDDRQTPANRFSRIQWAAFMRNLMLFHECRWINDPVATYRAEHKAIQLSLAAQIGFPVPETWVTNAPHPNLFGNSCHQVALKGLDTVLLRANGQEMFGFTTFERLTSFDSKSWLSAPATIQEALTNKTDIRVTVVEDKAFATSITVQGKPIFGDWRIQKDNACFSKYKLPIEISERCCQLVKLLGLNFGAIDLALHDDEYYFLEINPTGEWAWLVDSTGLPIDEAISNALARESSCDAT